MAYKGRGTQYGEYLAMGIIICLIALIVYGLRRLFGF